MFFNHIFFEISTITMLFCNINAQRDGMKMDYIHRRDVCKYTFNYIHPLSYPLCTLMVSRAPDDPNLDRSTVHRRTHTFIHHSHSHLGAIPSPQLT